MDGGLKATPSKTAVGGRRCERARLVRLSTVAERVPVLLEDEYGVADDSPVRLTVTTGERQLGLVSVYLGGGLVVRAQAPLSTVLGDGGDLRNRLLEVRTIVNDVSDETNRMSVTYELTGGDAPRRRTSSGEVATTHDFVEFVGVFELV